MAKFNYAKMQATASRLLERFNQGAIVLTKPGTSTPGPNPWDPPIIVDGREITLSATAKAVSEKFIDGTTILATDVEVTAADFGSEVEPADVLTIDGRAVSVIKIMRIPAAGVIVNWKFIVRG